MVAFSASPELTCWDFLSGGGGVRNEQIVEAFYWSQDRRHSRTADRPIIVRQQRPWRL